MCMTDEIDKLASRHIAKLLRRLDGTLAPIQISEIKRQIRFFADDVKSVKSKPEVSANEEQETTEKTHA